VNETLHRKHRPNKLEKNKTKFNHHLLPPLDSVSRKCRDPGEKEFSFYSRQGTRLREVSPRRASGHLRRARESAGTPQQVAASVMHRSDVLLHQAAWGRARGTSLIECGYRLYGKHPVSQFTFLQNHRPFLHFKEIISI